MGFCDVAPGEMKHLRVAYLSAGRPHVALLTDLQVGSAEAPMVSEAFDVVLALQHLLFVLELVVGACQAASIDVCDIQPLPAGRNAS